MTIVVWQLMRRLPKPILVLASLFILAAIARA